MGRFQHSRILVLALLTFFSPHLNGQAPQTKITVPIEITQVDLFALKGWTSRNVSVCGFMLGMSRTEVFRVVQQQQLRLDDDAGQGCLKEKECNALNAGRYIGLRLFFGENSDALEKITIETPSSELAKEDKSAWLVNKFQGETQRFFNTQSDDMRASPVRLLGSADSYWGGTQEDKSNKRSLFDPRRQYSKSGVLAIRGYEYRRLGLVMRLEYQGEPILLRESSNLVRLTVDFVPPRGK